MNFSQLNKSSKATSLNIIPSIPTVFHIVPEFGTSAVDIIFSTGIRPIEIGMFISKSQQIKLGIKSFNTRKIFTDAKTKLATHSIEGSTKQLEVLSDYPIKLQETLSESKKIAFIDQTILSQGTQFIVNQTNVKNGAFFLLQQLKKEISFFKTKFPQIENNIIFALNETKIENGLSEVIEYFGTIPSNMKSSLACFDRFMLVSMTSPEDPLIFPIAGYKKNSPEPEVYKSNFKIIDIVFNSRAKAIEAKQDSEPMETSPEYNEPEEKIEKKPSIDDELDKLNINRNQLIRVFKKYDVRDKNIADNIKVAIKDYINSNPKSIKDENIEKIVLLAINKTLFNTDNIDDHYINNPIKLFSKLNEVNTYSQEMVYPKTVDNYILEPSKTIDLKRVTSLVRHKYEFSDTIHNNIESLFEELQVRPNDPIKVMKIEHNYEDNNLNRFINYTITLKNLTGKNKKPYKVNIKIPALVNDRYFKLNGKNYILSNQQFFVPITKTEPDECRLINSYQTLTLSLANLKINVSEISKFIQYIQARYPDRIIKKEEDVNQNILSAVLKNEDDKECKINLIDKIAYECGSVKLVLDEESNKWTEYIGNNINKTKLGKSEYLFDVLERILKKVNPLETTNKSQKSIPYIVIHLMALKIPLIIYMWQQLGLIQSLQRLGIKYEETEAPSLKDHVAIPLENGRYLCIYPKTRRETLIINGLYSIDFKKYRFKDIKSLHDKHSIDQYLLDMDTRSLSNLDLLTANVLDTITKEILENDGNSTNIIDLLSVDMVDKLLNDQPDSLTDLKIYRNRQAEIIYTLLYRVLMMAHRTYTNEMKFNDDAKLFLSENYVTECLLGVNPHMKGNAAIELVNPYSPITELKSASKIIKTGPRGLPNKRMIKAAHRNIHPSYYGNIGANATTEYADVGVVNHLTLSTLLSNKYGSFGIKNVKDINGWEMLTLDEALVPFINEMQADRVVLAYTHRAQIKPIKNGEVPIISTGAEFVVPQLASNKFVNTAKHDGEVIEVKPNEYLKVKYDNNTTEYIDITPRLSSTKRSAYISLDMNTKPVGYKFKQNELLSWTNSFNGDAYTAGQNLTMAIMNYEGFSHEDGYVITEDVTQKFITQSLQEVSAVIPLNSKIFNMVSEYVDTKPGDVLLEFGYAGGDLDNYLDSYGLIDDESEEAEEAVYNYVGNNIRITSPGGQISEIKIYINNKSQVDPSIIQIWKKLCTRLKTKAKLYEYGKTGEREKIATVDNLDMSQLKTGNHKIRGKEFEGARVIFYIKKDNPMALGDKLCNRYGGKGVVSKIIEKDDIPRTDFSGNIDIFLSPFGLAGRKNLVVIKELYLGKILYHLPKILKEKAKSNNSKELIDIILHVYDKLDCSKDKKYYNLIHEKIQELVKSKKLVSEIADEKLKFILMCEPFHNTIPLENINDVADYLKIPLDEYVYIPNLNAYTKNKVPVGIQFMQAMEQTAEEYQSLRSTGKYKFTTGQPEKGKANLGGQSLGNWDVYSLISTDVPNILKELMTTRSDDFKTKREMTIDIIQNGSYEMPDETGDASTKELYRIHMIAMGLSPI